MKTTHNIQAGSSANTKYRGDSAKYTSGHTWACIQNILQWIGINDGWIGSQTNNVFTLDFEAETMAISIIEGRLCGCFNLSCTTSSFSQDLPVIILRARIPVDSVVNWWTIGRRERIPLDMNIWGAGFISESQLARSVLGYLFYQESTVSRRE